VVLVGRLQGDFAAQSPGARRRAGRGGRKALRPESASLVGNNRAMHQMLVDGVEVEYKRTLVSASRRCSAIVHTFALQPKRASRCVQGKWRCYCTGRNGDQQSLGILSYIALIDSNC